MSWMLLANGAQHYLSGYDMRHNTHPVPVLAHHIAQLNRYNGAARRPISVAEHSLLCADIAHDAGLPVAAQMACLVHDLHEAITGDCTSPIKAMLGDYWAGFESTHARELRQALGLRTAFVSHRREVRQIDLIALATERRDLLPYTPGESEPWPLLDTPGREVKPHSTSLTIFWREQLHWSEWRDQFIERYTYLRTQMRKELEDKVRAVTAEAADPNSTETAA